ncbi:hypothetical protein [Streptomyces alfalfae]|uniref:Methyltransferase MycE N-terminal domain-containing protein n=1 Tax=Streptomyces alfalfae TaxID=1642299 RepID=A0A7T4U0S6_9ACTN|nr:hypothetical protein [Streptomyces alfalfae]QQC92103.1 hypothetical protein I8755_29665 [Streptomyces alfalfae]QUI34623.1 class I SAM-dependent methyltransferase [Streptomyces alfalfae]
MTDVTHALIAAADRGHADVAATVEKAGLRGVAAVLINEMLFRAHLDELAALDDAGEGSLVITLTHGGEETSVLVSVGPGGVEIGKAARPAEIPPTVIVQGVCEAALALYGPPERVSSAGPEIRWPSPHTMVPRLVRGPAVPRLFHAVVQRVVHVLERSRPAHLTELAVRHGTDKWGFLHQYTQHYERHFGHLRDRPVRICEIGVGGYGDPRAGGGSLSMWKEFFPRGLVYGVDIADKRALDRPRITTVRADQSDPEALRSMAEEFGPFDIIIDDGSHMSPHVITSFRTLFPYLVEDGVYAVEDLHGSYWPQLFEGSEDDLNDPAYTVGFLKQMVDGLNHEEFLKKETRVARPTDRTIKGMHFYHNLAFIEKGRNEEGGPIASVLREAPEILGVEGLQ